MTKKETAEELAKLEEIAREHGRIAASARAEIGRIRRAMHLASTEVRLALTVLSEYVREHGAPVSTGDLVEWGRQRPGVAAAVGSLSPPGCGVDDPRSVGQWLGRAARAHPGALYDISDRGCPAKWWVESRDMRKHREFMRLIVQIAEMGATRDPWTVDSKRVRDLAREHGVDLGWATPGDITEAGPRAIACALNAAARHEPSRVLRIDRGALTRWRIAWREGTTADMQPAEVYRGGRTHPENPLAAP